MEKIRRKTLLYKTKVEYGDYTINHALGCSHGCTYPCYAYLIAKRFRNIETYNDWIQPKIVENAPELLINELKHNKHDIKSIQLCFTTDPFMMGYDEVKEMSLKLINIINDNGINAIVLTKGILPSSLINYSKGNEYGITLITLNEKFKETIEPYSSNIEERINSLKYLHDNGCYTWVSIEPYPTPNIVNQDFDELLQKIDFVDKIIFGKMNYNKMVTKFGDYKKFYNECSKRVILFCEKNNIKYHIKNGTMT